jgi:hypothetical protein
MEKQIKGRAHDRDDDRGEPNLTQEQKANLRAELSELSGTGIITEDQAAEILDVVPETLQAWRYKKRYDLPYLKIGSLVRYRRQDIADFLERRLVKAEDATQPARARRVKSVRRVSPETDARGTHRDFSQRRTG